MEMRNAYCAATLAAALLISPHATPAAASTRKVGRRHETVRKRIPLPRILPVSGLHEAGVSTALLNSALRRCFTDARARAELSSHPRVLGRIAGLLRNESFAARVRILPPFMQRNLARRMVRRPRFRRRLISNPLRVLDRHGFVPTRRLLSGYLLAAGGSGGKKWTPLTRKAPGTDLRRSDTAGPALKPHISKVGPSVPKKGRQAAKTPPRRIRPPAVRPGSGKRPAYVTRPARTAAAKKTSRRRRRIRIPALLLKKRRSKTSSAGKRHVVAPRRRVVPTVRRKPHGTSRVRKPATAVHGKTPPPPARRNAVTKVHLIQKANSFRLPSSSTRK